MPRKRTTKREARKARYNIIGKTFPEGVTDTVKIDNISNVTETAQEPQKPHRPKRTDTDDSGLGDLKPPVSKKGIFFLISIGKA